MPNTFPEIQFHAWDTAEIASPVGVREIPGGSFAFMHKISFGCNIANPSDPVGTSGVLQFEDITISNDQSYSLSKVAAVTVHLKSEDQALTDLRLYLGSRTALNETNPPALVQYLVSGVWVPNITIPSGAGTVLTTTIPTTANVFRHDGVNAIIGTGDNNSSQFIYMNLIIPNNYPLGSFGVCTSGLLRFNLLFNYYSKDFLLII